MEVINTSGRRKCSVARAYVSKGTGVITIKQRDYKEYFKLLHYNTTYYNH